MFFSEKNKTFVKIIHIFYLKNIIIFRIVLLRLNNHKREVFDFVYCFRLNIFTSKISNLLLPLGVEEVRSRESYPTNDIPNKYICDAFLMIYLSVLLFLVIRRS